MIISACGPKGFDGLTEVFEVDIQESTTWVDGWPAINVQDEITVFDEALANDCTSFAAAAGDNNILHVPTSP